MSEYPKITGSSLGTNARVLTVQLRGFGATGGDDDAAPYDAAEVVQPLGLKARPVASDTLEAVPLEKGEELLVLAMVDKGIPTKLGDSPALEEGETRLEGASKDNVAAMIRIKANGDIVVIPKSGQKVYLGGDTSTQPTPLGTDLNNYLDTLRNKINSIIDVLNDLITQYNAHKHAFVGTGTVGIGDSPEGGSPPVHAGGPPSLSSIVENK